MYLFVAGSKWLAMIPITSDILLGLAFGMFPAGFVGGSCFGLTSESGKYMNLSVFVNEHISSSSGHFSR